jgi:hypothetical protein
MVFAITSAGKQNRRLTALGDRDVVACPSSLANTGDSAAKIRDEMSGKDQVNSRADSTTNSLASV